MPYSLKLVFSCLILMGISLLKTGLHAQSVLLNDLSAFKNPAANWKIVGHAYGDPERKNNLVSKPGSGILVNLPENSPSGQAKDLIFIAEHGDADVEFDFLMAAGSNSGVYLQGRYEIQLLDSWGKKKPTSGDCGGIYERWDNSKPDGSKGYEGHAPRLNATRAPGLWQNMKIAFQAPRFNSAGIKIQNAKILSIELNGSIIQENIELTGPTRAPLSENEVAAGPLRIQGDHGPVAFRNFVVRNYSSPRPAGPQSFYRQNPIFLNTTDECIVHRSFIGYASKKIPHGVSVGDPLKINYAMDLDNGTLIRVWRGDFLDVTPMWNDRGDGMSFPLGSALTLEAAQGVNTVAGNTSRDFRLKGYKMDGDNRPTFRYEWNNITFTDELRPESDGKYLKRTIKPVTKLSEFTVKAADGASIELLENEMYRIDGKYYIKVGNGTSARISDAGEGRKVLIASGSEAVTYFLIW